LRKTIGKVKSLSTAEGVPGEWKEVEKGEKKEAAVLNVQARLFKVGAVKEVVDSCVGELKGVVGVGAGAGAGAKKDNKEEDKRKKAKVEMEEDEEVEDSSDDGGAFASFNARIAAPSSAEEDSDDSLSDGRRPPSLGNSDEEDFDIDALESEAEASFTHSEGESDLAIPRDGYIVTDEDESSDSEEPAAFEGFSDDVDEKSTRKIKTNATAAPAKVSTSTFLPSLSHAAYFSGSDSDSEPEDLDIDVAPKKNRRGQRARQKIWEAKFGEKAKHKQKDERNQGWDPKRGAVSDDRGGKGGRARGPAKGGRGPQVSGENTTELGPRKTAPTKRDDTGALHPSWQAAKAAKEKKMAAKPEGTKIVFD
jgi:hypothetical protein